MLQECFRTSGEELPIPSFLLKVSKCDKEIRVGSKKTHKTTTLCCLIIEMELVEIEEMWFV